MRQIPLSGRVVLVDCTSSPPRWSCSQWTTCEIGALKAEDPVGFFGDFLARRGLSSADHDPVRYRELVAKPRPRKKQPLRPAATVTHPAQPAARRHSRPWRIRAAIPLAEPVWLARISTQQVRCKVQAYS